MRLGEIVEERAISVVFQPIRDLAGGGTVGHEALVRGPPGTWLESPIALFAAARQVGQYERLAIICIQETLRAFAAHGSRGLLFLNMSPRLVQRPGFDPARARRFLEALELCPARVVIELTEDFPAIDMRFLRESLLLYRSMGFRVALDDLGEGFSTLRLWSELRRSRLPRPEALARSAPTTGRRSRCARPSTRPWPGILTSQRCEPRPRSTQQAHCASGR